MATFHWPFNSRLFASSLFIIILIILPHTKADFSYLVSLGNPPAEIDYNYYGSTVATTSSGHIASVGYNMATNETFIIVSEFISSGIYSPRSPLPVEITGLIPYADQVTNRDTTSILMSDNIDLIAVTNSFPTNNAVYVWWYNSATTAYQPQQTILFDEPVTDLDMARDGFTLIATTENFIYIFKLSSTNTSAPGNTYLQSQPMINETTAGLTMDAYARFFAVLTATGARIYNISANDTGNQGIFAFQQEILVDIALTLQLTPAANQILINGIMFPVFTAHTFVSYYNETDWTWGPLIPAGFNPRFFSVSDYGERVAVQDTTVSQMYSIFEKTGLNYTFVEALAEPPWSLTPGSNFFALKTFNSFSSECDYLATGYFKFDTSVPYPIGEGQPVIYSGGGGCAVAPVLPPFTPPVPPSPPPVSPPPTLPPLSPIIQPPLSPSVVPNYVPTTKPPVAPPQVPPSTPVSPPVLSPEQQQRRAVFDAVKIAILVAMIIMVILVVIYVIKIINEKNAAERMQRLADAESGSSNTKFSGKTR